MLKGSSTIRAAILKETLLRHKYKLIVIGAIILIEIYVSYQFYSKEPIFPTGLFEIDAGNAIARDLLLAGIFMFVKKHMAQAKKVIKECCPVLTTAFLWVVISILIANSLKLVFNVKTILSIFAGTLNNIMFVLLASYLHMQWNNLFSKITYFASYFCTLLFFYTDSIYFFITSTHVQKVLFENLNSYSTMGVLYTADRWVAAGILLSFICLLLLFRVPQKPGILPSKHMLAGLLMVFFAANFIDTAAAYVYPKALLANGYDEEAEIEKARNLSRNMITSSVTVNLIREFVKEDAKPVTAANQPPQRFPFSKQEKQLLNNLKITVNEEVSPTENAFPYEKIIIIVAESFHRDYIHSYNPQIPAEATPFFDELLTKYPHSDHYYTSNKPTTQGLNSIFLSQIIYSDEQSFDNNVTLFKVLQRNGYETVFLEATSQYYNDEFREYKKRFGMNIYRGKEDLERQGYVGSSGWGFHNDVMYEETIRILEQNRNNKIFIVTKTIDSHQPYPYCGFSNENIPAAINEKPFNLYLKAIYWENTTLQKFFRDLEKRNLLDDKTLVIFTSDHGPHPSQDENYKILGKEDLRLSLAPLPLIFVSPNLQPFDSFNRKAFASQVDLAPTLLGVLGIHSPSEFSGRNMTNVPEERSFAIGSLGETIYYRSKDVQIETDMYTGKNQTEYEKALIHWVQDLYVKYFHGNQGKQPVN